MLFRSKAGEQSVDPPAVIGLALFGKILRVVVDDIDVADAVGRIETVRPVPDGLREDAGDEPAIWQVKVVPGRKDRAQQRAGLDGLNELCVLLRVHGLGSVDIHYAVVVRAHLALG